MHYASYILFYNILPTNTYYIKYNCAVCVHTIKFCILLSIILRCSRRDGEEDNYMYTHIYIYMRLLVKFSFCLAMLLLGVVLSRSFPMPFKGSFREGLEVPRSDFQYKTCQYQRRSQVSNESGTLGMVPKLFNASRSPLKGDIFNKYPLYQVYVGLNYYGYHPKSTTIFAAIQL